MLLWIGGTIIVAMIILAIPFIQMLSKPYDNRLRGR